MTVDRNYPRLDGTLSLTRARVAEVKVAQVKAHAPEEREVHESVLTDGRPQHTPPPRVAAPVVRPVAPEDRKSTLSDAAPHVAPAPTVRTSLADAKPTVTPTEKPVAPAVKPVAPPATSRAAIADAKPLSAPPRPPAIIDPQRAEARARETTLPVSMPRVTAPPARDGGAVSAPEAPPHQSVLHGEQTVPTPAYDLSRIVWRAGLATR